MISEADAKKFADVEFDTVKSSASAEKIEAFMGQEISQVDVVDIPGVGPALAAGLKEKGITTAAQLLGCFLLHVKADSTTKDVCDTFVRFCKSVNNRANPHTVTFAIANYADHKGLFKYEI
eukprot:g2441.t1